MDAIKFTLCKLKKFLQIIQECVITLITHIIECKLLITILVIYVVKMRKFFADLVRKFNVHL